MRFVLVAMLVSFGGHWALVRWALRSFPRLRRRRGTVWAVAVLLALLPFVTRVLTRFTWSPLLTDALGVSMIELTMVVLGLVPMLVLRGVARVVERVTRRKRAPSAAASEAPRVEASSEGPAPPALTRREAVERVAGLAAWGLTGSVLGWGFVRGRYEFEVTEVVAKIPGLPRALEGYVIAQVSDTHTGAFVRERELADGLALVRAMKPDLLVATGDLVDFEAGWTPLLARALADLPARDGRFAILGNHDYYANVHRVIRAMEEAGIPVLVNEGRTIRGADGGGFALLGVDDLWAARAGGDGPDLERAMSMVPKETPRILLAHQPKYFDEAAGKVALQLSGHTHGGQINPGFRPADLFMHYVAGRYEKAGSTMYVNRGFGVAGPPSRVGAPPEITKVVLVSA